MPDKVCKSGWILANFCNFSAVTKLELFTILQFCIKIVTNFVNTEKCSKTPLFIILSNVFTDICYKVTEF